MFFDNSVICKGKDYIKGKVEGVLCFRDEYAMRQKREDIPAIPVIFNNHKIGIESVVNCDGIIVFEDCFSDYLKELIDKLRVPCVLISRKDASVDMVSVLVGKKLSAKEGERVVIDGRKVMKAKVYKDV